MPILHIQNSKKSLKEMMSFRIELGGISHADILLFTRHLAVTLKTGLTLVDGIIVLYDQAAGKMKRMLGEILNIIQSGQPFHAALAKYPNHFPSLYVSLIKTGELAGTLEQNLDHLAEQLQKAHELRQKVKSAMMYPMLVFIAIIGLGFAVSIFVLPKIIPLFKTLNVELPATTRALIFIAEAFANHAILIVAGTVGICVGILWLFRRNFMKPFTHRAVLMMPVVKKISRNMNLERFTRILGMLLMSGIAVDTSLKITADAMVNRAYRDAITSCVPVIEQGNTLATALMKYPKLFPRMVARMIDMGERTGSLEGTLKYLSEFYEGEVDTTMKNLSSILEPFLLIFIGIIMGTVALSILGPIYKITGSLRR